MEMYSVTSGLESLLLVYGRLGGLGPGLSEFFFLSQSVEGGDADDVAFHGHSQLIHFQHQIENLIPGHRFFQGSA